MEKESEQPCSAHKFSDSAKELVRICKFIINEVKAGRCGNDEIATFLCNGLPSQFGYFREDEYVTADEAMKILHLNQNRNKFFALLRQYKINACKFKGLKIGYRVNDIYKIKKMIEAQSKKERGE